MDKIGYQKRNAALYIFKITRRILALNYVSARYLIVSA